MSVARMGRYNNACNNDSGKAIELYRLNLKLSQELYTIISCFEVTLRNAIDVYYTNLYGNDWLKNGATTGGIFDNSSCHRTATIINLRVAKFARNYSHAKILTDMDFGFWRYLFAQPQFAAGGRTLLQIFPAKPKSTRTIQYNNHFVFNELSKINHLRNRIAHHEPVCFRLGHAIKDSTYAREHYALLIRFFQWMSVDEVALLNGIEFVNRECNNIDAL
jgi:hypothetical protein